MKSDFFIYLFFPWRLKEMKIRTYDIPVEQVVLIDAYGVEISL